MNGEPMRNSYLRSEIATFVRTLVMLARNAPDDRYALGWLDALGALASLAGIDAAHITDHASRITHHDDGRLLR